MGQREEFYKFTVMNMDNQVETIARTLFGVPKKDYGTEYEAHLLEQYKQYLDMADKISERRSSSNSFFLTVNAALISGFGIVDVTTRKTPILLFIAGSLSAITLCFWWFRLISAYRDLGTAKFKVVHEIEKRLPIRPFDAEWEAVGRGEDKKLYWPFTHIERRIPWVFIGLYLLVIVYAVYQWSDPSR
jgi:hypothetical protein